VLPEDEDTEAAEEEENGTKDAGQRTHVPPGYPSLDSLREPLRPRAAGTASAMAQYGHATLSDLRPLAPVAHPTAAPLRR